LGGYNDTFVERDAVAYAIAQGCVVVAAMGNDDVSTLHYPAAYPNVVAVGAVNQSDQRVSIPPYGWGSNTGSHIDVVAPGVTIRSTDWDNAYSYKQGTSMAAPHVSGVAALIKSCKSSLTGSQVAQIIRDTSRALKDDPADPVPNDRYGHGIVDAKAAVDQACPKQIEKKYEPEKFPDKWLWPDSEWWKGERFKERFKPEWDKPERQKPEGYKPEGYKPEGFKPPVPRGTLDERMSRLEAMVGQLTHFIRPEFRPDLGKSALRREPDES
jgi:hypothetical protein